MKKYINIFFTMFKIGLFTFGGGYAMIALLENEFVHKKKWMSGVEFVDLVSIAESTPGPITINSATYIGYKVGGILGATICSIAVCIPAFVIIYTISLFFDQFLSIKWVVMAFSGIRVGVVCLILLAGIRLFDKLDKSVFSITVLVIIAITMLILNLLAVNFSSIFYILISGAVGVIIYVVGAIRHRFKEGKK